MTCETIYRHTCDRCAHICESDSEKLPVGWEAAVLPARWAIPGRVALCDTCTNGLRKFWSYLA